MEQENNKGLIIGVVVILLLAALFLLFGGEKEKSNNTPDENTDVQEAEQVQATVNEVDLNTTTGLDRLPTGFPTDAPVRTESIVDSVQIIQEDGRTEALVTYESDSSVEDIRDAFVSYIETAGYEILENEENTNGFVTIFGINDDESMSVAISSEVEDGMREVFVSYVVE